MESLVGLDTLRKFFMFFKKVFFYFLQIVASDVQGDSLPVIKSAYEL